MVIALTPYLFVKQQKSTSEEKRISSKKDEITKIDSDCELAVRSSSSGNSTPPSSEVVPVSPSGNNYMKIRKYKKTLRKFLYFL